MKKLALALGLGIVLAFILYVALDRFSDNDNKYNLQVSLSAWAFLSWIFHQVLIRCSTFPALPMGSRGVVSIEEYGLPWHILYFYGTVGFVFAKESIGSVVAAFSSSLSGNPGSTLSSVLVSNTLFVLVVAYFVGWWIGCRNRGTFSSGVTIVFITVSTGLIASMLLAFILIPDDVFDIYWALVSPAADESHSVTQFIKGLGFSIIVCCLFGVLGFWIGRRNQLKRYLVFLMTRLPKTTHAKFVDLVYAEAKNVKVI